MMDSVEQNMNRVTDMVLFSYFHLVTFKERRKQLLIVVDGF